MSDMTNRKALIEAARTGIATFLGTTRGAHMFGANATIVETPKGFAVVYKGDNRAYFDVVEM